MKTTLLVLFYATLIIWMVNKGLAQLLKDSRRGPQIRYADWIYDERIHTPLLNPQGADASDPANALVPPLLAQDDGRPLVLEFDDLLPNEGTSYRAKILSCNADWTLSPLNDVEYLSDYNDFPLYNFQTAVQTKVAYAHYTFEVPSVKLPGNYVLLVFKGRNSADAVLTRRFMVYANRIGIDGRVSFSTNVQQRNTHQQLDFDIRYGSYQVLNPREDLTVVIRQNYRWDNALKGLKPFGVNDFDRKLEYHFFNGENTIPAGNEFRYFDIRSTQTRGYGVNAIERQAGQNAARLNFDTPEAGKAYVQTNDLDGLFIVDNTETHRGATEADYWPVLFNLKTPALPGKAVYVVGGFNGFNLTDANKMTYNPDLGVYQVSIPFKQGVYNYAYALDNGGKPDTVPIEGSFSQTQNVYEILVYHRPVGARADQLVGYKVIK